MEEIVSEPAVLVSFGDGVPRVVAQQQISAHYCGSPGRVGGRQVEVREVGQMMRLPKIVAALEQHLAEVERLRPPKPTLLQQALADCGCYVCPDQVGHSVIDGVKRLAGPFTTESEAWS